MTRDSSSFGTKYDRLGLPTQNFRPATGEDTTFLGAQAPKTHRYLRSCFI